MNKNSEESEQKLVSYKLNVLAVIVLLVSAFLYYELEKQREVINDLKVELSNQTEISKEIKDKLSKLQETANELQTKSSDSSLMQFFSTLTTLQAKKNFKPKNRGVPKIKVITKDAKLPNYVITPINRIATLGIDDTGLITRTRTGKYPENVQWIIVLNNEQKLARIADNELQYRYPRNFEKGIYKVYLKRFNGKNYEVISNVVSYKSQ